MTLRSDIATATARALSQGTLEKLHALVGFDGFVDEIIDVVDQRHSHDRYDRLTTIAEFAGRIGNAAGTSGNFELVTRQRKLGGNGPIMANALAMLGMRMDYVGTVGDSVGDGIDPVFAAFHERATLHPLAPAAHTSALEFLDGKLMLGNLAPLSAVTWEFILARLRPRDWRELFERSHLLGLVNWTMLPHLTDIWRHVARDILPQLSNAIRRRVFIDLADPAKRPVKDLAAALAVLTEMNPYAAVTLGLNASEARQTAHALNIDADESNLPALAARIRAAANLATVVIHPRHGAAAARLFNGIEQRAEFSGPFLRQPAISTGAGDHFNAGFAAAELLDLPLEQCLCLGTALSGYYVRNAASPNTPELAAFLAALPPAE